MDPNVTLAIIRQIIATTRQNDYNADADAERLLNELVPAVASLDDWLSTQGFLPSPWSRNHDRART